MKNTLNQLLEYAQDVIAIFYPRLCLACESPLPYQEKHLCFKCQIDLPKTDFHQLQNNDFTDRFIGRFPLQAAAAMFFFTKESRVQTLIHAIKYEGKHEVATELGRIYGESLQQSPLFGACDCVVPVPMHPKKQHLRGYNQAEKIAEGLAEALHIPLEIKLLQKIQHTESQTKKSKIERLENTEAVFCINEKQKNKIAHRHFLLVDDVLTTGATLESCAKTLLQALPDATISAVTLAFVKGH